MVKDEARRTSLKNLAKFALVAGVPGCGGGGSGSGAGNSSTLQTLELTSAVTTLALSQSVTLVATARYSDGVGVALGAQAGWQSSNPAVATVAGDGRATAVAAGRATITASYQSFSASFSLRVGTVVQTIELYPPPFRFALGLGGSWQLHAVGQGVAGASDINPVATWTSSAPAVASVGDASKGGLLMGVAAGSSTISCSLDGVSAQVVVQVLSHQRIAYSNNDVVATQCEAAADANGRALAVWSRGFSSGGNPDLAWSQYRPGMGWSAAESLRPVSANPRSASLVLSMLDSGLAVAAWQQPDGLFAATFRPGAGWAVPVRVDAVGTSFGNPVARLLLKMDDTGGAVLVWTAFSNASGTFVFSTLSGSTAQWSAAASVPDSRIDSLNQQPVLVGNFAGEAALVWSNMRISPSGGGGTVQVIRWKPAEVGPVRGWQPREVLLSSPALPISLAACMDESGSVLVGWIQGTVGGPLGQIADTVQAVRYVPSQGWGPIQAIVSASDQLPGGLALTCAAGQGGGALWTHGWDGSVQAARMSSAGVWSVLGEASDNNHPLAQVGSPRNLQAQQLADGRLIYSWIADDNFIGGVLAVRVHQVNGGWGTLRRNTPLGRLGNVQTFSLSYGSSGLGTVVWAESNQSGGDLFGHSGWQP